MTELKVEVSEGVGRLMPHPRGTMTMFSPRLSILVADSYALYCEGVSSLLESGGDVEVVGEASNGNEVLEMAKDRVPDVVLIDAFLPPTNGVEIVRRLRAEQVPSKVLLLTQREQELDLVDGFRAGVNGFISKKATFSSLVSAIAGVCQGDYVVNLAFQGSVVHDDYKSPAEPCDQGSYQRLSPRERQILKLVAEGSRTRDIAGRLNISAKTVLGHRCNMKSKLGVHNQTELVKYAVLKHADAVGGWERLWSKD